MNYQNSGFYSQSKARVSQGTQCEIEIQFEFSNKDLDQPTSLGMDQSKARVTWGTQGGIEIRTLAFARIRVNPEPVGALKGRSRASRVTLR